MDVDVVPFQGKNAKQILNKSFRPSPLAGPVAQHPLVTCKKMRISLKQGGRRHLPLHNASGSEACKRSISKAACCFTQHLRRSGLVMWISREKIYCNALSRNPLRIGLTKIAKQHLRSAVN